MSAPTIVLVHGAFADSSGWRGLTDRLAGEGFNAVAPPNGLRGLTGGDGAYLKAFVERIDGPALLVGHSYGGSVITAAGTAKNVVGLVYVAGYAPDEGESLQALQSNFPAPPALQYFQQTPLPDGGTEAWLSAEGFHPMFCADLPAADAAFMYLTQRPLALVALTEEAGTPAWRSRPAWAVLPTADQVIHPDVHRFSFERANATVTEVEGSSHVVMISHPDVVAEVVVAAARESAAQPA
jgi:pimeloyl-ACP methyl ester carboxylesterase